MQRRWTTWLLTLWLSACGGGGGAVSLNDYEAALARTACAKAVLCGYLQNEEECRALGSGGLEQVKASVKAGKVHYDGAAAADCIAFHEAATCSWTAAISTSRCEDTFKGTLGIGAACLMHLECKSVLCDLGGCDGRDACCRGTCVAGDRQVALGGDCTAGDADCVDGTFCTLRPGAVGRTCHAVLKEGEACDELTWCEPGLWCPPIAAGVGQVCTRMPNRGEPCNQTGLVCDSAQDFCDPDTLTCVAKRAVGDTCGGAAVCIAFAYCDDLMHKCIALPKVGEACSPDEDCQEGAVCESGTCVIPPPPPVCPA